MDVLDEYIGSLFSPEKNTTARWQLSSKFLDNTFFYMMLGTFKFNYIQTIWKSDKPQMDQICHVNENYSNSRQIQCQKTDYMKQFLGVYLLVQHGGPKYMADWEIERHGQ